jgi:DNA-directed RNA polymerase specialized sigma24 family protein
MRLAFLMTGSNAVAEDLVHDVFVRVADRIDSREDPAPYLRMAVVNACRRHLRRAMRLARPGSETGDPEPPTADAIAVRQALPRLRNSPLSAGATTS